MVADELATRAGAKFGVDKRSRALTASMRLGGPGADGIPIVVGKPMSYMNRSGGPTSTLAKYYGVAPTDIVVIHDDLDLPFGTIRLKRGGGSGGHNGLKDLAKALGGPRSEEHTSELQSRPHLVCRLLLEKKKNTTTSPRHVQPRH